MNNLAQAVWVEALKVRRSKMLPLTAAGFALMPLVGGLFMVILKDPEFARRAGLISAKAQLAAGVADWPTYLSLISQATAVGGLMLYSLIGGWLFGREYAEHTVKDLLALPTPRAAIVLSKFITLAAWLGALTLMVCALGLAIGLAVDLPPVPAALIVQGGVTIIITALLTLLGVLPVIFFASAGRGYLPPMGAALLALFLGQVMGVLGWGAVCPWSVPALYAQGQPVGILGYVIVLLTGAIGVAATFLWWQFADQTG